MVTTLNHLQSSVNKREKNEAVSKFHGLLPKCGFVKMYLFNSSLQ